MSLTLNNLSISLKGQPPLFSPLSLEIEAGEIVTIIGASGVGKSTLLDVIGGYLSPAFAYEGEVFIGDKRVDHMAAEKREIGVLFQDALLFPHLSVGGNLAFGLKGGGRNERRLRIEEALEHAGLGGFYDRDPETLSGGQKARIALLRSLLANPRALLLDEPFSKLDPERRDEIRAFVFEHIRAQNIPVLLVTHDEGDAKAAKGRVISLTA